MRPKQPEAPSEDLFRSSLETILCAQHPLLVLAAKIDWDRLDKAFGAHFDAHKGRAGLPTRLMAGLHLLKHMKGLSDEELCAVWVENPYYQAFCGERYFQHQAPFDRSSMTRWRQRIGAKEMDLLVAETVRVARETGAVTTRQLSRVVVREKL